MKQSPQAGFTLLEVMIVLVILAVLMAGAGSLLTRAGDVSAGISDRSEALTGLVRDMDIFTRDVTQITNYALRLGGRKQYAFYGDDTLFTCITYGWPNGEFSDLSKVHYEIGKNGLNRWRRLAANDSAGDYDTAEILFKGASDITLRYLNEHAGWELVWPPHRAIGQTSPALPRAIEIRFRLPPFGEISRIVRIEAAQ